MKCTIRHIDAHSTALTLASVLALFSVLFIAPMAVILLIAPPGDGNNGPGFAPFVFFCAAPLFYFVFGYITLRVSLWIYNKINGSTGGIRFTIETDEPKTPAEHSSDSSA